MGKSYYDVLNIPTNATQRDIKVAYRKLVQKHHPDVNTSGNEELIKQINVAYGTLSNSRKKTIYDQRLASNFSTPQTPTYRYPPSSMSSRRRAPFSYQYRSRVSGDEYSYSTKTKLLGWAAVVFTLAFIWFGMRAMHVYASNHYFKQGVIAEANKEFTKAFNFYQLAVRDWGNKNVEASIKIVELNLQMGSYYAMVDNAEKGLSFNPDSTNTARLFYLKGLGYVKTQRYPAAENAFINSLAFNFNKDSIYRQLAPIYITLANYNKAEKAYTHLLASNFKLPADYYNRALSYQYLGNHQMAINDLLILLKEDAYNGKILFQLGRSYLALNNEQQACYYLRFAQRQGININPADFEKVCN